MKLTSARLGTLLNMANSFKGQEVIFAESISDNEEHPIATFSRFNMVIQQVAGFSTGTRLAFDDGDKTYYEISLELVEDYEFEESGTLEIVEHLGAATTRRTRISPVMEED